MIRYYKHDDPAWIKIGRGLLLLGCSALLGGVVCSAIVAVKEWLQ